MASPRPELKASHLYNRLLRVPFTDQTTIGQIEWQLRQEQRHFPQDPSAAVALLEAYIMQGKGDVAHHLADYLFGLSPRMDGQVRYSFMTQLVSIGLFDRAIDLIRTSFPAWQGSRDLSNAILRAAIGRGDLALALEAARAWGGSMARGVEALVEALSRLGLTEHFPAHQTAVVAAAGKRFVDYVVSPGVYTGQAELAIDIFIRADRNERRALEAEIDDKVASYCEAAGLAPCAFTPLVTTLVHDITAHWPNVVGRLAADNEPS